MGTIKQSFSPKKYLTINQPIGDMYIFKMKAEDVINISAADIRTFEKQEATQRRLDETRVVGIESFCKTNNAFFPTPVILSSPSKYFILDEEQEMISLNLEEIDKSKKAQTPEETANFNKFCSIVDGQHRLEGIRRSGKSSQFDLIVMLVLDTEKSDDAYLFSTINGNQKPISKSLIYDLFRLSDKRSVEKVCSQIVKALNSSSSSKLQGKIKMLGIKEGNSSEATVSQATMVDSLIKLISKNVLEDNLKLEQEILLENYSPEKYVFREWFIKNKETYILNTLQNFFNAWIIKTEEILNEDKFNYFSKTIGFLVGFKLLKEIFLTSKFDHEFNATQNYYELQLEKILTGFKDLYFEQSYGSSYGEASKLFSDLLMIAIKSNTVNDKYVLRNDIKNVAKSLLRLTEKQTDKIKETHSIITGNFLDKFEDEEKKLLIKKFE